MATVVLVRHGETAWNREGRIQGWAPTGLTDRGREQARRVGAHVTERYDPDRVVASDLRRARETVAEMRESGALPDPQFSPAWRERNFGVMQGLTGEELFGQHPEHARDGNLLGMTTAPEAGESYVDVYERVAGAWDGLLARADADDTAVVVTHGGPLSVLWSYLQDRDIVEGVVGTSFDNASVTEVDVDGGDARIVRRNEPVQN
ncbi:MAG: histidine phosphatase family protein [Haloarculaceae archaeon]